MASTSRLQSVREGTAAGDARLPSIGHVLDGRYRLDAHIGAGGFAAVYRATNLRTNQEVAIKVLIPQKADARTQERFSREVDVVTQLRHPNTVTVFDRGQTSEGLPYLVMELLHGAPLDEWVARHGRLSPVQLRHVAVQVLRSLVEAHDANVIHRDIKPANLFVASMPDDDMFIKVLDFGLAKSLDPVNSGPKTTNVLCTPAYAPPERLHSNVNSVQTDIYAVGMTLVEVLQGHHPLAGYSVARIIDFHLLDKKEVTVPAGVLNTPLGSVLKISLARNPEHRFTSARAMLNAFAAIDEQTLSDTPLPLTDGPQTAAAVSHLIDLTLDVVDDGTTLESHHAPDTEFTKVITESRGTPVSPTAPRHPPAESALFSTNVTSTGHRTIPIAIAIVIIALLVVLAMIRVLA